MPERRTVRSSVPRYVPTIGNPTWDIREASDSFRKELKTHLRIAQVYTHEEYQRVICYLYKKFPHEMDLNRLPDGRPNVPIQWHYSAGRNAVMVQNRIQGGQQDMYAFIVYDAMSDMEPVAFAGSYFTMERVQNFDRTNQNFSMNRDGTWDADGGFQLYGNGIVMFVDPHYRRLGLATDLWWAEAALYREALKIRYQKEIQNTYSLESTRKMFKDPSKCIITSEGRLKQDGTRAQIRCLLDYTDQDVIEGWEGMLPNLRTIYDEANWRWTEREQVDDLDAIWQAGKLVR